MGNQEHSFAGKRGPLVPVTYSCVDCHASKIKYQPQPWEPGNKDFRQYCWKCRMITQHTQQYQKTL